jgi:hypothetical protein
MTSAQGFTVVTSKLRTHAGVLNQVAGTMGQALGAAKQVTLSDTAYGQLPVSASLAGLVKAAAMPAEDALSQAQTALSSLSTAVATTAANYDTVEHGNTGRFNMDGAL